MVPAVWIKYHLWVLARDFDFPTAPIVALGVIYTAVMRQIVAIRLTKFANVETVVPGHKRIVIKV